MAKVAGTFLIAFAVWLATTWTFDWVTVPIGALVSLGVAWGVRRVEVPAAPVVLMPTRMFWALVYIPVLLLHVVRANLDVAYRVLHPALPIRPGIVKARTTLSSVSGRVLLANSITLTPGTLSVDLRDDTLYIHRIWVPESGGEEDTRLHLARFERYIERIFR